MKPLNNPLSRFNLILPFGLHFSIRVHADIKYVLMSQDDDDDDYDILFRAYTLKRKK